MKIKNNLKIVDNKILKLDRIFYESLILIIISSVSILIFMKSNTNNSMLNFYYNKHVYIYYILILIYSIFVIGIVSNLKFIMRHILHIGYFKIKNKKLKKRK